MRRGEIWSVSLEPTKGREQQGARPVMIVSPDAMHKTLLPIVCPIATAAIGQRMEGLTVSLTAAGTKTTGVVLCHQVRALDIKARSGRRVEAAPDWLVDEVLSCLQDMFEQ